MMQIAFGPSVAKETLGPGEGVDQQLHVTLGLAILSPVFSCFAFGYS